MYRLLHTGRILPTVICSALLVGAATAQATLRTYNGDAQDDRLGQSVSCAGDVNNDGFDDVIVGAPEDGFVFNLREGYARVYSGLNGSPLFTLNGSALAQAQGMAVDGAGNVNGDANDDVVVGAPTGGASLNGIVRVYSGLNQAVLYTFTGAANDELGRAVAGAGDVNNDGRDDIIVGAPNADGGGTNAGFARVYSGLTGGVLYTINGTSVGDRVGISVDGVGDLDGDGFDEFIVGSAGAGVRVYDGQTGGVFYGPFTGGVDDAYGVSVAGAGDVDNDNIPDFAIGATQDSNVFNQLAGYVELRSGATGNLIRTLTGAANAERFGASVSGAGDVNGDGFDEVIVGADQSALNLPGYAKVYSGINGATLHTLNGVANGERFGSTVAGCGDLDGNGKFEFVIGSPFASPVTGTKAGSARHVESNLTGGGPSCLTANFCVISPNSAGAGASISNSGSTSLLANDLTLITTGLPQAPIGIYFYGAQEVQTPFGNGQQCAGGPQVFRIGVAIGSMGTAMLNLNMSAPIFTQVTSGSTWKFQYWFRDVNGGGAHFNLSDGLSATFCD